MIIMQIILKTMKKREMGIKPERKDMIAAAVCILGMVFYGVEHSSGQVRSPVPAVLPPIFLCNSSLAGHGTLKPLDLLSALLSTCQTSMCHQHYPRTESKTQHCVPAATKTVTLCRTVLVSERAGKGFSSEEIDCKSMPLCTSKELHAVKLS